ncbi:MAG: hypothetical protein QG622_847 [Actinomycetota bacterium]|nr:hypothetical protein [Actinomycetota bacterium]
MRRPSLRRIAGAAALIMLSTGVVVWHEAPATAAATRLPFTVTNNSGRGDATYVYVIARQGGKPGYVDAGGTWHAFDLPKNVPAGRGNPAAPDLSIPGPGNGASTSLILPPDLAGGRVYLSIGSKLSFALAAGGLVEPAPWTANDASHDVLFDWVEFARTGTRIFINTTMVDMFSLPMTVSVTGAGGTTRTAGQLRTSRGAVIDAATALGSDWAKLVYKRPSDGLPLRVLAPSHGIRSTGFNSTYLDQYIDAVWQYHAGRPLTIDLGANGTFTGRVSGTGMAITDSRGAAVGTLTKPSTVEAFECSGGLQPTQNQPNLSMILAVGARVCAGINRGTMSTSSRPVSDTQPVTDAAKFYQQDRSNLYSKVMHDNSVDSKAYGFSYDDVSDKFAPTIDEADPVSSSMTVGPLTGGGAQAPKAPSSPGSSSSAPSSSSTPSTPSTPSAPSNPSTPSAPSNDGATGTFIKGLGGKCVDVSGDATGGNGAAVQLSTCREGMADQRWTRSGNAVRTLGRCLDVAGAAKTDGSKVQLYDCNGTGAQQWVAGSNGSLRNSGSGLCLQPVGGSTRDGTRLEIRGCDSGAAQQKFTFAA